MSHWRHNTDWPRNWVDERWMSMLIPRTYTRTVDVRDVWIDGRLISKWIQENPFGLTAVSGDSHTPAFRRRTSFPSSGYWDIEDGDEVRLWDVGVFEFPDAAGSPRRFHWILSPRKLQDISTWMLRKGTFRI